VNIAVTQHNKQKILKEPLNENTLQKYVEHLLIKHQGIPIKHRKIAPEFIVDHIQETNRIKFYRTQTILGIVDGLLSSYNRKHKYGTYLAKLLGITKDHYLKSPMHPILLSAVAFLSKIQSTWFDTEREKKKQILNQQFNLHTGGIIDAGIVEAFIFGKWEFTYTNPEIARKIISKITENIKSTFELPQIGQKFLFALYKLSRLLEIITEKELYTLISEFIESGQKQPNQSKISVLFSLSENNDLHAFFKENNIKKLFELLPEIKSKCGHGIYALPKILVIEIIDEIFANSFSHK